MQEEKKHHLKEKTAMKMRMAVAEDKAKDWERQNIIAVSEFDKERALLL